MKYKKVRTWKDIINDPRIEKEFTRRDYDGTRGKHHVGLKDGLWFANNEATIEIGTVSEICYSLNNWVEPNPHK